MEIKIQKKQNRSIHAYHLCALAWMNVLFACVIVVQQQHSMTQAYLLHRTPGRVQAVKAVRRVSIPPKARLQTKKALVLAPTPIIDAQVDNTAHTTMRAHSTSSVSSVSSVVQPKRIVVPSPSSTSTSSRSSSALTLSLRPAAPSISNSATTFPEFGNAVFPVQKVPNWGAMTTPAEWNRSYTQMSDEDFVDVPSYALNVLTIPVDTLEHKRNEPSTIDILTKKLLYSTRYFGAYDIDATEFTAIHPGIDIKLPNGTPIGSVAGGRVHDVRHDEESLGTHIIIEHRADDGNVFYSIYGHLDTTRVKKGDAVSAGQMIGTVGITGNTSGPHIHLQIDRGTADETYHTVYWPESVPTRAVADRYGINPITFIQQY